MPSQRHQTQSPPRIDHRASRHAIALLCIALLALGSGAPATAQTPTPRAHALVLDTQTANEATFAVAEPLASGETWIGFYVTCKRAPRTLEAGFSFGSFPAGKRVQAAIRTPTRHVERFGPVLRGTPASGFHSPLFNDPGDVRRFLTAAFQHGSLISNGHNSVWNELSEPLNRRVRAAVNTCLNAK